MQLVALVKMAPANHLPLKLYGPIPTMQESETEYELRKSLVTFFEAQSSQMHNFEMVLKSYKRKNICPDMISLEAQGLQALFFFCL